MGSISVIIPTIARYPFLRDVLSDLAAQTETVDEVLVVDQSRPEDRDISVYRDAAKTLPLRVFFLTVTRGTCVSRNLAIVRAQGDSILFFDDDVRFGPDLIAHYRRIAARGHDVVHGGVRGKGKPLVHERFQFDDPIHHLIASPNWDKASMTIGVASGNVLVRRSRVSEIGGFDCHFNTGVCDDWDFGLRLFQSGATMVYAPEPVVEHLKAGIGGRRPYFRKPNQLVGGFAQYDPTTLAPRLHFYMKHFPPRGAQVLCEMKLREIWRPEKMLFRYPWAAPVATAWWFEAMRNARTMSHEGPQTIGRYVEPHFEEWNPNG